MKRYGYIYMTKNLVTGKMYIGLHTNAEYNADYFGSGVALKDAMKVYGNHNFINGLIEWAGNMDELSTLEQLYIEKYNSLVPNGYNLTTGGETFKHHELSKKKISENQKGIPKWNGTGGPRKGAKHTKKSRKKISDNHADVNGENNGMYGKNHSEETIIKIKEARSKQVITESHKKAVSEWATNFWKNEDKKQTMIAKVTGIKKPKVQCPHCKKVGGKPVMVRYHFDKCKQAS
jgi:group I intron endonuclease